MCPDRTLGSLAGQGSRPSLPRLGEQLKPFTPLKNRLDFTERKTDRLEPLFALKSPQHRPPGA
jgi:hypothetical protein